MGIAGLEVMSRAFQDRIFISCSRLVGTKEVCCQKSKYAILKLDKIHSAILLGIGGICRPEGNFVGEKFVCCFFPPPNSGVLLKIKEQKRKIFFSQTLIYFRFVSVL